ARSLDDVELLARLDHAEAPGLELERPALLELGLARLQPRVLGPHGRDVVALALGLGVRRDPRARGPDVEIDDEGEDADQRPAPDAVPADARRSHPAGFVRRRRSPSSAISVP